MHTRSTAKRRGSLSGRRASGSGLSLAAKLLAADLSEEDTNLMVANGSLGSAATSGTSVSSGLSSCFDAQHQPGESSARAQVTASEDAVTEPAQNHHAAAKPLHLHRFGAALAGDDASQSFVPSVNIVGQPTGDLSLCAPSPGIADGARSLNPPAHAFKSSSGSGIVVMQAEPALVVPSYDLSLSIGLDLPSGFAQFSSSSNQPAPLGMHANSGNGGAALSSAGSAGSNHSEVSNAGFATPRKGPRRSGSFAGAYELCICDRVGGVCTCGAKDDATVVPTAATDTVVDGAGPASTASAAEASVAIAAAAIAAEAAAAAPSRPSSASSGRVRMQSAADETLPAADSDGQRCIALAADAGSNSKIDESDGAAGPSSPGPTLAVQSAAASIAFLRSRKAAHDLCRELQLLSHYVSLNAIGIVKLVDSLRARVLEPRAEAAAAAEEQSDHADSGEVSFSPYKGEGTDVTGSGVSSAHHFRRGRGRESTASVASAASDVTTAFNLLNVSGTNLSGGLGDNAPLSAATHHNVGMTAAGSSNVLDELASPPTPPRHSSPVKRQKPSPKLAHEDASSSYDFAAAVSTLSSSSCSSPLLTRNNSPGKGLPSPLAAHNYFGGAGSRPSSGSSRESSQLEAPPTPFLNSLPDKPLQPSTSFSSSSSVAAGSFHASPNAITAHTLQPGSATSSASSISTAGSAADVPDFSLDGETNVVGPTAAAEIRGVTVTVSAPPSVVATEPLLSSNSAGESPAASLSTFPVALLEPPPPDPDGNCPPSLTPAELLQLLASVGFYGHEALAVMASEDDGAAVIDNSSSSLTVTAVRRDDGAAIIDSLPTAVSSLSFLSGEEVMSLLARANQLRSRVAAIEPTHAEWSATIAYTIGVFDTFHRGHANLLAALRAFGGRVVVGVHTCESIAQLKGRAPIQPLSERLAAVAPYVDATFIVAGTDPTPFIQAAVDPEDLAAGRCIYVRGDDMPTFPAREWVEAVMPVVLLPRTPDVSSSFHRLIYHNPELTAAAAAEAAVKDDGGNGRSENADSRTAQALPASSTPSPAPPPDATASNAMMSLIPSTPPLAPSTSSATIAAGAPAPPPYAMSLAQPQSLNSDNALSEQQASKVICTTPPRHPIVREIAGEAISITSASAAAAAPMSALSLLQSQPRAPSPSAPADGSATTMTSSVLAYAPVPVPPGISGAFNLSSSIVSSGGNGGDSSSPSGSLTRRSSSVPNMMAVLAALTSDKRGLPPPSAGGGGAHFIVRSPPFTGIGALQQQQQQVVSLSRYVGEMANATSMTMTPQRPSPSSSHGHHPPSLPPPGSGVGSSGSGNPLVTPLPHIRRSSGISGASRDSRSSVESSAGSCRASSKGGPGSAGGGGVGGYHTGGSGAGTPKIVDGGTEEAAESALQFLSPASPIHRMPAKERRKLMATAFSPLDYEGKPIQQTTSTPAWTGGATFSPAAPADSIAAGPSATGSPVAGGSLRKPRSASESHR